MDTRQILCKHGVAFVHNTCGLCDANKIHTLEARVAVLEAALKPMVGHDDPSIHHAACAALGINPAD